MPPRMSGKLLNLGVQDWLWRGYGALMRALPRFRAHYQRSSQALSSQLRCLCGESRLGAALTRRTAEKAKMTKLVEPVVVNLCFDDCSCKLTPSV
jgi:hypothetical protein